MVRRTYRTSKVRRFVVFIMTIFGFLMLIYDASYDFEFKVNLLNRSLASYP